jgi:hypothetical protein
MRVKYEKLCIISGDDLKSLIPRKNVHCLKSTEIYVSMKKTVSLNIE